MYTPTLLLAASGIVSDRGERPTAARIGALLYGGPLDPSSEALADVVDDLGRAVEAGVLVAFGSEAEDGAALYVPRR